MGKYVFGGKPRKKKKKEDQNSHTLISDSTGAPIYLERLIRFIVKSQRARAKARNIPLHHYILFFLLHFGHRA